MANLADLEARVEALEAAVDSLTADVETVTVPDGFVPLVEPLVEPEKEKDNG